MVDNVIMGFVILDCELTSLGLHLWEYSVERG